MSAIAIDRRVMILAFLALLGVYFLGRGITGYAIGQSCCFPPNCHGEDVCSEARPSLESPAVVSSGTIFTSLGLFLLISVAVFINMHHRNMGHGDGKHGRE